MEYKSIEITSKYLRSRKIPSTACSGCGLGMNHKIVVQAIEELGLEVGGHHLGDIHRVCRPADIRHLERGWFCRHPRPGLRHCQRPAHRPAAGEEDHSDGG